MKTLNLIKDYEDGKRTMDGYTFDGRAEFDSSAIERAYSSMDGYQLERQTDKLIDSLYDGYEPIYETDIGLCSVITHWETKEPLVWCKVKREEQK